MSMGLSSELEWKAREGNEEVLGEQQDRGEAKRERRLLGQRSQGGRAGGRREGLRTNKNKCLTTP